MYGEDYVRTNYSRARKRGFDMRHPPLVGRLSAWREWQSYQKEKDDQQRLAKQIRDHLNQLTGHDFETEKVATIQ